MELLLGTFRFTFELIAKTRKKMENLDDKIIANYMSGTCTDAEMEELRQWFAASDANKKEWLRMRMALIKGRHDDFAEPEKVESGYGEVVSWHIEKGDMEREITRKVTLRLFKYAASILILIGVGIGSYTFIKNYMTPKMLMFAVADGQPAQKLTLSDSTAVWVSANSSVEYPEKFGRGSREVAVKGRAYFDVKHDENRPFLVKSKGYTVKVLGTAFEVNAYDDERFSDVTLVRGRVNILGEGDKTLCALRPGQRFELDKRSKKYELKDVNAALLTGWHSGKMEFDGMTLGEIVDGLEHYYNVQLVLAPNVNKNERLVGSLSVKPGIQEMMKTIGQVLPIKFEVQTGTVVYVKSK